MMGIVAGEECYISAHEYLYLDACIKHLDKKKYYACLASHVKILNYIATQLYNFCITL